MNMNEVICTRKLYLSLRVCISIIIFLVFDFWLLRGYHYVGIMKMLIFEMEICINSSYFKQKIAWIYCKEYTSPESVNELLGKKHNNGYQE